MSFVKECIVRGLCQQCRSAEFSLQCRSAEFSLIKTLINALWHSRNLLLSQMKKEISSWPLHKPLQRQDYNL